MTQLLSIRATARKLGVSYETVRRWLKDGRLQAAGRIGDNPGFDSDYVEHLATERANKKQAVA